MYSDYNYCSFQIFDEEKYAYDTDFFHGVSFYSLFLYILLMLRGIVDSLEKKSRARDPRILNITLSILKSSF